MVWTRLQPLPDLAIPFFRLQNRMTAFRPLRWLTARLAMAAVWLMIVSPVVSQLLPAPWQMPDLGATCGASHHGPVGGTPASAGHALEKCGYCGLFSHCPTLSGAAWVATLLPRAPELQQPLPSAPSWMRPALLAAAARGPPLQRAA